MNKEEFLKRKADLKSNHELELRELNNSYCCDKSPILIGDIIESWDKSKKIKVKSFVGTADFEANCMFCYRGNIIDINGNETTEETNIFSSQLK